jgi:hypothetical protein
MQMKYLSIFLFVLGLILQTGCTSQAKKTHLVFEKEYVTYGELNEALEDLKPVGHEGATHHQYKAVKALRHIAKYMNDPAKREMGVRALVFLAAFNDDRNVRLSAESRLNAILDSENDTLALKVSIIDEQKNIITAKSGYTDEDRSFLSGKVTSEFIYPEIDARENALEFLTDRFEDLPEYLQYVTVQAFGQILNNPATCYEIDNGVCNEDDSKDQEDWKQELREQIGTWLEEPVLSQMIKTSLVRIIQESIVPAEASEGSTSKSWLERWVANDVIPKQTRDIIQAALNILEKHYPDLTDQDSQSGDSEKDRYKFEESYRSLDVFDNSTFWYANSAEILKYQLFLTGANAEKVKDAFMQVPSEWLFFTGFSNEESAKELKEIIFHAAIEALGQGYLLSPANEQMFALEQTLVAAAKESIWALDRTLSMTAKLYPSLLRQEEDVQYLVDFMIDRISTAPELQTKRLYYYFLAEGMPYFQPIVEPALCSSLKDTDLLTRHLVKVKVASLQAPVELLTITKHRKMQSEEAPLAESETDLSDIEDNGPYIQSLCDEELAGLKPQIRPNPKLEEQKPDTVEAPAAGDTI